VVKKFTTIHRFTGYAREKFTTIHRFHTGSRDICAHMAWVDKSQSVS